MADDNTDILMKFTPVDGSDAVIGESRTDFDSSDPMMEDFVKGHFVEIDKFSIGTMKISDNESKSGKNVATPKNESAGKGDHSARSVSAAGTQSGASTIEWLRWKSMVLKPGDTPLLDPPYRFTVDACTYTRMFDKASMILFQSCVDSTPFDTITLVKRKTTGSSRLMPFLRVDFDTCLITNLNWENDDKIKEKTKFVFRGMTISYLAQAPDGSLVSRNQDVTYVYSVE